MNQNQAPSPTLASSRFIAFFDECGDHSMVKINPQFPLFVLALVVVERTAYRDIILPEMNRFKLRYWNHEGVNLHSRDIRVAAEPFNFLLNASVRRHFMEELSQMMDSLPFTLFIAAIHKQQHLARFCSTADEPYDLALKLTMDRLLDFLAKNSQVEIPMVAESRGTKEDNSLRQVFYRILSAGAITKPAEEFKKLNCTLTFQPKLKNIVGTQIADLCAYPCARHILSPQKRNDPYEIVREKIYNRNAVTGWTVFP